jgi:hypothetical protein
MITRRLACAAVLAGMIAALLIAGAGRLAQPEAVGPTGPLATAENVG